MLQNTCGLLCFVICSQSASQVDARCCVTIPAVRMQMVSMCWYCRKASFSGSAHPSCCTLTTLNGVIRVCQVIKVNPQWTQHSPESLVLSLLLPLSSPSVKWSGQNPKWLQVFIPPKGLALIQTVLPALSSWAAALTPAPPSLRKHPFDLIAPPGSRSYIFYI